MMCVDATMRMATQNLDDMILTFCVLFLTLVLIEMHKRTM